MHHEGRGHGRAKDILPAGTTFDGFVKSLTDQVLVAGTVVEPVGKLLKQGGLLRNGGSETLEFDANFGFVTCRCLLQDHFKRVHGPRGHWIIWLALECEGTGVTGAKKRVSIWPKTDCTAKVRTLGRKGIDSLALTHQPHRTNRLLRVLNPGVLDFAKNRKTLGIPS